MITNERILRHIPLRKPTALDIAERCYEQWMGEVSFTQDLANYLIDGVVISRPDLFGMARIVNIAPEGSKPEPVWFVRMAVGNLVELLDALPYRLPKICFCRRNDGRMRVYSFETLRRKAAYWRERIWAAAA
jgi:hypothetical protein